DFYPLSLHDALPIFRHAAVLRLQHERLFRSLAAAWQAPAGCGRRIAAHLLRQLVPQGPRRQVRVARVWREHARAEVDDRPHRWNRRRCRAGIRGVYDLTGYRLDWPGVQTE